MESYRRIYAMENIIFLATFWTLLYLANGQTPTRMYEAFITGSDPALKLNNRSLCFNSTDSRTLNFQRLLVQDDSIYIGATNHILQIDVNTFSLSQLAVLGPHDDDEVCIAPPICTDGCGSLTCKNNYNRLLITHRDQLLVCGSIYLGTCDVLKLSNVSEPYEPTPDERLLKCQSNSQITKHTDVLAVASIFVNGSDAARDLFYIGSGGSVETYYPPDSGVPNPSLTFTKIDQTSTYTSAELGEREYLQSWTTNSHSYMLWTTDVTRKSKISRLCHNTLNDFSRTTVQSDDDRAFGQSSYTETNIACSGLTDAILAFRHRSGKLYVLFTNDKKYLLCSIGQNHISDHIVNARSSCFKGETDKASYINNEACDTKVTVSRQEITCGLSQEYSYLLKPVRCKTDLIFQEEFVWPVGSHPPTTVAVDLVNGFTTGFFGTEDGEILKAKLGDLATDFVEKILLEEGQPILNDVGFGRFQQNMFAMTSEKIFKVKLSDCQQYTTCSACLNSNDPYCGWCVLQNSCTQKPECTDSSKPTHWMKIDVPSSQCPHVSNIEPNSLSVTATQRLSLTFGGNTLPATEYQCEFTVANEVLSTSPLQNFSTTPTCMSPPTPPDVPEGQDNLVVSLRVRSGKAVVATGNFNIYDCRNIPGIQMNTMCTSCLNSRWACNWCPTSNTCNDYCSPSDSQTPTHSDCPAVVRVLNNSVHIPVGKAHDFVVQTRNLPKNTEFLCVVNFCNSKAPVLVRGVRDEDEVRCSVDKNKLNCEEQDSTVRISLKSGDYVIDTLNVDDVTVGLFNCTGRQAECGLCMNFRIKHDECAWCDGSSTCVPRGDCDDNSYVTNITSCPSAVIETFNPPNGPVAGGTEISLDGTNLGSKVQEISLVTIGGGAGLGGGVQCTVLPEKYVPSKRIVCKTEGTSEATGGKVRIQLTYASDDVISAQEFRFKPVSVEGFEPKYALNGAKVTITGNNLDVGNGAFINITNSVETLSSGCAERNPSRLTCRVPEVQSPGSYKVLALLDGFEKVMSGKIQFVSTPRIVGLVGRSSLVSYESGGLKVTFEFSSLLGIQRAIIEVETGERSRDCELNKNTTSITCALPSRKKPLPLDGNRSKRSVPSDDTKQASPRAVPRPVSADIVINDKVRIPLEGGELSLSYVDDPVIEPLKELPCQSPVTMTPQMRHAPGNDSSEEEQEDTPFAESTTAIQLRGSNLDAAATKEDYMILITPVDDASNPVECKTTFLESTSLICRALDSELSKHKGLKVQVTVKVGNYSFTNPTVDYCVESPFSMIAIAVIVPLVVILVIIIFGLLLWNRQRAKKQQKEREQIMLMLDTLENKTRETARKAYFELQLGYMTTLTDNLSDSITYLPPVSCFMRALFNDWKPDHPMLTTKTTEGMPATVITGLDKFIHLLKNRDFLILLIKTLEEQKHFTVKEKGQFASLLTVCLFDDMVYFTRIMLDLLSDLIQRHVSKNPKLLLRRSESVVEKMVSHWLCINLYSQCIREQAGKPLFLLTKAIHFLVSSAPSDVVANKAVNSLNEMTLLGTEVTYEVITLHASVVEKGEKTETIDVKVVNVDTITQVKEKIIEAVYRDRPFSEWPKADDMELELIAGQGHLVLSDIDNMSLQDGGYTQINTLKYYNVPDGAGVLLSPMKKALQQAQNGSPPATTKPKKRLYHLISPRDKELNGQIEEDDGTGGNKTKAFIGNLINQPFQEIYLTRMVKSKTTVQEYVDGVFNAILAPDPKSRAVKYFFQFLDREASKHKINDPEVVHIWKTNSLLLRYWVNVLKNPEFLFDVNKTMIVDSCLNVITQAFMDACTTTNHKLGQDSPSNKLLYAKDAERYREMVSKFFTDISNDEAISDDEINRSLTEISKEYGPKFNRRAAAQQLFNHLDKYRSQVQASLEDDQRLTDRLNEVLDKLSPESNGKDAALMV